MPRIFAAALRATAFIPSRASRILVDTYNGFSEHNALTRGAAIAFYGVTSLIPVLLIVIAVAGLVFGEDAARGAVVSQIGALIGVENAKVIENAIQSASNAQSGVAALIIGFAVLIFTASGVFGELQSALNAIWEIKPRSFSLSRLVQARATSFGLVTALGFLLLVSLAVDAAISAASGYLDRHFAYGETLLLVLSTGFSFGMTSILFVALYKVLPDTPLDWRDVLFGGIVTAIAFQLGKIVIAFYLGRSEATSSYGAAGALASVLLWIYYSSIVVLLGAAFSKACTISNIFVKQPPPLAMSERPNLEQDAVKHQPKLKQS